MPFVERSAQNRAVSSDERTRDTGPEQSLTILPLLTNVSSDKPEKNSRSKVHFVENTKEYKKG
jgi:hypothetical protein